MSRNISKYLAGIENLDNFEYRDDKTVARRDKKLLFLQYIRDNNLIYTEDWNKVPVGSPYIHINFGPANKKLVCPEEFPQTKESEDYLDLDGVDEDGFIMLNQSRGSSMYSSRTARGRKSKRTKSSNKRSKSGKRSKSARRSKRRY
jgi:hypothetical protein